MFFCSFIYNCPYLINQVGGWVDGWMDGWIDLSVWNSVLTSWPPIFTKIFSKISGLNDYRLVTLTSVVMKSFEKLVLAHLKDITGSSLDPLQFANRANRSVDNAVNICILLFLNYLFFLILLFIICFFCSITLILLHCGSFCHKNRFLVCVNIPGNKLILILNWLFNIHCHVSLGGKVCENKLMFSCMLYRDGFELQLCS